MSCPHGLRSSPTTCSLCLGAAARRVVQQGPVLVVDGVEVRPIELPQSDEKLTRAQRRGGKQRALRAAPRSVKR